jgi:hypothetical protein
MSNYDDDDCPMDFPRFALPGGSFDDDEDNEPDEWTDEELMSLKRTFDSENAGELQPGPVSQRLILSGGRMGRALTRR